MNAESLMYFDPPDGRRLEVRAAGREDGEILLFHHGTPFITEHLALGSRSCRLVKAAAARGLRTVMYSRPGYGTSTPQPGRQVIDAAADAAHVMDAVGAATFRTIGWSGGGPHALTCAAALPDRCLASVAIASVAPYPADGIDWLAGVADENVEEFSLSLQGPDALTPFLEAFANSVTTIQPAELAEALGGLLSEVDKAQVTGELAERMLGSSRIGLAHGVTRQRDEDLAFMSDWGFELRGVQSVAI